MTDESNYVIAIHRVMLIGRGNCFGIGIWLWFFDSHLKALQTMPKTKIHLFFFLKRFTVE